VRENSPKRDREERERELKYGEVLHVNMFYDHPKFGGSLSKGVGGRALSAFFR